MSDPNIFLTFLTFAIPIAFGTICYFLAIKKGRNEKAWAVIGFLFCFIAFALLLCLPKKEQTSIKEPVKETSVDSSSSVHNESAAALNNDEAFEPRKPRISGSKALSWYYIDQNSDNTIKGPYTINELRKEVQTHKLESSTYVWCEEYKEWTQIAEFSNSSLILDADFIE